MIFIFEVRLSDLFTKLVSGAARIEAGKAAIEILESEIFEVIRKLGT